MRQVFITGAAGGIGGATAQRFARAGDAVFGFDHDGDGLERVARTMTGGTFAYRTGDVRSREDICAAIGDCERRFGPIDVLINHAGIGPSRHVLEISEQELRTVIEVNLSGIFRVGQEVARRMVGAGRGTIINMASTGGIATEPGHAAYGASKAAIVSLTRTMASELAGHGIRVHAICPGDVDTYEWGNVELARIYRSRIAAGRSGDPSEIANVYYFLASHRAESLNGTAFVVDGGMLAWE